jgi:DNA-binding transcriptional regulator WhiA
MAGNKDKGDDGYSSRFSLAVGRRIPTMFYKEEEPRTKEYLILLLNYSIEENKTAIHTLKMTHYIQNNVYVYFRYNNDETVMVHEQQ